MSALPIADEGRIVNVIPASGWWCVVGYRKAADMFPSHYARTRVGAWAVVEPGCSIEALVAGDSGCGLSLAHEIYPRSDLALYADDDLPVCDCGRRRGGDPDPSWCRTCGAVIPE